MGTDLRERRVDRAWGRRYIPHRSERSKWPGGETGRSARGPDGGRQRQPTDPGAPETPDGQRGCKVTQPERSLRRWRRLRGRAQRPAGTSQDGPAGVRRPGPTEGREAQGGPPGSSDGRKAGRRCRRATKADGRREATRPPAIRALEPGTEGGSGQLSPRNRREPNASAGGDRRSLGLFLRLRGPRARALPSRHDRRSAQASR
jgi:hypothetical protein